MSIEDIIKAWKSDEEGGDISSLDNPVGTEINDQELQEVTGGCPGTACTHHISCFMWWTL